MTNHDTQSQLGFDALLAGADSDNRARKFERETAHLPATYDEAIPFYRGLIEQNHAAMLAADVEETVRLHDEVYKLALRLNGGKKGIIADEGAPGCVLERETAADTGIVPLWGQTGDFIITVGTMRVRIELDGMFGLAARFSLWPGFSALAVDYDLPFISETGYRSFLGIHADLEPDLTPDAFTQEVIVAYVERELKGKLVVIAERFRP